MRSSKGNKSPEDKFGDDDSGTQEEYLDENIENDNKSFQFTTRTEKLEIKISKGYFNRYFKTQKYIESNFEIFKTTGHFNCYFKTPQFNIISSCKNQILFVKDTSKIYELNLKTKTKKMYLVKQSIKFSKDLSDAYLANSKNELEIWDWKTKTKKNSIELKIVVSE